MLRVDRHDDPERGCRLIEIALCNDRETPRKIPVNAWLYQTRLTVTADGAEVFLPVSDPLLDTRYEPDDELRRLNLQYRDRLRVRGRADLLGRLGGGRRARGGRARCGRRGCRRARRRRSPPRRSTPLLDMRELAAASPGAAAGLGLSPIVERYAAWLDGEEARARELPEHLRHEGLDAVSEARKVQRQLADGLEHLLADAGRAALLPVHERGDGRPARAEPGRQAPGRSTRPSPSTRPGRRCWTGTGRPHSWFTFQLAFILMQLPLLTDPAADKRSGDLAKAQLLFFPTGGGKTEAYLGLAAYAFAIRRLQGVLETPDGPLDGRAGVTVLMRYTLRLLTAQQFQRATALVCAAELAPAARRGHLGHGAVPDRAVGRDRREPEALRRGRGAAQAGRQRRAAATG